MSRFWTRINRTALALATVATAAVFAFPSVATAQFGQAAGIARLIRPEYTRADVRIVVEGLELDDMQRLIIESLFEDYQTQFDAGFNAMRDRLSETRDLADEHDDPSKVMEVVFAPLEDWRFEREDLGEELLENIRLVLGEAQLRNWEQFKRQLVREKSMAEAELAGEGANLMKAIQEMRLSEDALSLIADKQDEYDRALDDALRHRNRIIDESASQMLYSLQSEDADEMMRIIRELVKARVFVRDLNDRYRGEIAALLPDDLSGEFLDKALMRGYDMVYRRPAVDRMYEEAMALDTIDEDTRASIASLFTEYRERIVIENRSLMQVIRDYEPKAAINRAEVYTSRMTKEEVRKLINPIPGTMRKRDGVYEVYTERLQQLLSEEDFLGLTGAERWVKKRERAEERARSEEARRKAREIEEAERERQRRQSPDGNFMGGTNRGKGGGGGAAGNKKKDN